MQPRALLAFASATVFFAGLSMQACGVDPDSNFDEDGGPGSSSGDNNNTSSNGGIDPGDGSPGSSSGFNLDGSIKPLAIEPATANIVVRKINGVVTREPDTIQFVAKREGVAVEGATWFLQQGELGSIGANTGVFTPSGNSAGSGTIVATANGGEGQAQVVVTLAGEQNGGSSDGSGDGCGAGGCGGVGGEPLGGAVAADDLERLKNQAPEAADGSFSWLYPYDKTVFPRGILAPLLQWGWQPTAKAVSVKVTSPNVSFTGYYQYPNAATAVARQRVRVDQAVWKSALQANDGGQFLEIEVKLLAEDNKVYGPFKRQLIVSPAPLTGTVYYNSYNSNLTGGQDGELGGVLSIRVTSNDPAIAGTPQPTLPARLQGAAANRKCTGCHVVSADGSSLFVQDGTLKLDTAEIDYPRSMSFDLRKEPMERGDGSDSSLDPVATPADANKFLWAAPYPDGSFVLASAGLTREARLTGPSALFDKTGATVESSGLPADLWASTPAFSPDGRHVVFNFFQGTIPDANAGGRSLVLYDFSCGAADGQSACGVEPKTFASPRTVYSTADRYPAWPSFLADGRGIVFQNAKGNAGQLYRDSYSTCNPYNEAPKTSATVAGQNIPGAMNCHVSTWYGQDAEVWLAPDGGEAVPLYALNGTDPAGVSYLPSHEVAQIANPQNAPINQNYWRNPPAPTSRDFDDSKLNYQPTVNPVPSGGYYWVVFTSRRRYGNVLNDHPFHRKDNRFPVFSNQKKLWVAAVDVNTGAVDRSHPPFYLPGQELLAGNSRGFWAVDPCRATGSSCETGDQCCAGSCRANAEGALVCQPPPEAECKPEFDACKIDADCCGDRLKCINGRCAVARPNTPA